MIEPFGLDKCYFKKTTTMIGIQTEILDKITSVFSRFADTFSGRDKKREERLVKKRARQTQRLFKLLALTSAYHYYVMSDLQALTLKETDARTADEIANRALELYNKFKKIVKLASGSECGLSPERILSFCKRIKYGKENLEFKRIGHLYFHHILKDVLACLLSNGKIAVIGYEWFTESPFPINPCCFRQEIVIIEKLYDEAGENELSRLIEFDEE